MSLSNAAIGRQSDQGSADWLLARAGHATASRFGEILAINSSGKPRKARNDYLLQLVTERITGEPVEAATSRSLAWGTEVEAYARVAYEIQAGAIVEEAGFIKHAVHAWVGASSDGLVGHDGGVEIKCPHNSAVHLETWENGMPKAHMAQVQGQMWVLGLDWVDFCSYDPRMKNAAKHLMLYRQRVHRDEKFIARLETEVLDFLAEVQVKVNDFLEMGAAA